MQSAKEIINFAIVGSGHVATRLADAFISAGQIPKGILSNSEQGKELAKSLNLPLFKSPQEAKNIDLWILCIKDDALNEEYASQFPKDALVCHTAGSVPISILGRKNKTGVFYPLQTLSKDKKIDFANIPICLEGQNDEDIEVLKKLASSISSDIRILNSDQRMSAHLAAVFVSNFVNYCYHIGFDLLDSQGVDFNILAPLIEETANKIKYLSPQNAQTGPAKRGDQNIMEKHIELLKSWPEYQNIYKILSHAIERNK